MSRASLWLALLLPGLATATPPDVIEKLRTGQRSSADAAVVVGIETYPFLPPVPYAQRDADAFYNFLIYTRGLSPTRLSLLTGNPTATDIREALKQRAAEVGPGGTLWLYFAGHGAADPETGKRLLLGVDVQPKVSSLTSTQTVALDELGPLARGSAAAEVVAVVDACYTGTGRDGKVLLEGKRFAVPSFAVVPEPKVVTWTAASPSETSGPYEAAQHGLFTYFVVGALRGWADGEFDDRRDGVVTLGEARQYVYDAVRTVGGGDQTPTFESLDTALEGSMVRGSALEARPDLGDLVRSGRPAEVEKPAAAEVVVSGGSADFAAKLAELKRLRAEREASEARETELLASVSAERDRQLQLATERLAGEATSAWRQTVELLDAGGEEALLAAQLFLETYGAATVTIDGTSYPLKVVEVETARAWLNQQGASRPTPAPVPVAAVAAEVEPSYVGVDPLASIESLEAHPYWELPPYSAKLAKRLAGKIKRNSWDDELWGDAGDKAMLKGDSDLATFFYLHAQAIEAADSEWTSNLASLGFADARLAAFADRVRLDESIDETWGDLADALIEATRTVEACAAYQIATNLDAADAEWPQKFADNGCGSMSGNDGDALVAAQAAARAEPQNDERIGDLGDALMEVGRVSEACDTFQRALDLDPTDSEWPGKLLGCLETNIVVRTSDASPGVSRDPVAFVLEVESTAGSSVAVRTALDALALEPTEDERFGDLGDALADSGQPALALQAYTFAMLDEPTDREWQTKIAAIADYDRLFALFQEALRASPSNDELLGDFADRLAEAGRREESCQTYRAALRFDPTDTEWPGRVAECDGVAAAPAEPVSGVAETDSDAGMTVLADQLRADPTSDERWGDYADGLRALNRTDEACDAYRKANELDPVDNEWILAMDLISCSGALATTVAVEETDDEALGDQGDDLINQGDYAGACEAYRMALEADPNDSEWPNKLIACFQIASPGDDEVLGDLGDRLMSFGRYSEACAAYREALKIDKDDTEWKDRRADCRGVE